MSCIHTPVEQKNVFNSLVSGRSVIHFSTLYRSVLDKSHITSLFILLFGNICEGMSSFSFNFIDLAALSFAVGLVGLVNKRNRG